MPTDRTCQYNFHNTSGVITSPNYPDFHNNFEDCLYLIRVPSAVTITLTITSFDTEMRKDVLGVGQGSNGTGWREFSGQIDVPVIITYQTNQAFLTWFSDFNIIRQGWTVLYETGRWPFSFVGPRGCIYLLYLFLQSLTPIPHPKWLKVTNMGRPRHPPTCKGVDKFAVSLVELLHNYWPGWPVTV